MFVVVQVITPNDLQHSQKPVTFLSRLSWIKYN